MSRCLVCVRVRVNCTKYNSGSLFGQSSDGATTKRCRYSHQFKGAPQEIFTEKVARFSLLLGS